MTHPAFTQDAQEALDREERETRLRMLRRAVEKRDRLAEEVQRLTRLLRQAKTDLKHATWDVASVQSAVVRYLPGEEGS